jgi:hypothetical protein
MVALCAAAGLAEAQNVVGKTKTNVGTGHRVDANTAGVLSVMPKSLHDDLVLWQMFSYSDNSDANYYDLSASGNNGAQTTSSQQPTFSSSVGGHYSFDGVDDSFVVADDASLRITDTLTLSCWLNRSSAGTRDYIFSKGDDIDFWFEIGATDLITLWISATGSSAPTNYDYYREDASSIAIGLWHYVAVTLTASTRDFKIYVNGSESAGTVLGTAQGSIYASTAPLGVGFREKYSDNYFDGQLDDTRIHDRSITAAEVLAIANATAPTYYPYFSTNDYDLADYVDLALWLPFDTDETPDYIDKGPIGNDGAQATASSQPTFSSSDGGVYDFDGVDDFLDHGQDASLVLQTLSVSAWIKTTSTAVGYIFANYDSTGSGEQGYGLRTIISKIQWRVSTASGNPSALTTVTITDDTWTHVVAIHDASSRSVYLNGALDVTDSTSGVTIDYSGNESATTGATQDPALGDHSFYDGALDDVRVYDRALTAAEILDIGNRTGPTYFPYFSTDDYDFDDYMDLALWLPFDTDETPDYIDKGPIGNDGTQATASDQPTFSSDNGGVYSFDGVDDSISIAASTSLNAIGNLMTITAWLKLDAHGWQMILIKGTGAAHPIPFQFSFNPDGDLNFYQSEGGAFVTAIAGTVPVPTNQWTFVAAVNDGSDAFVYINAVQADTDATPATAVDTDTETLGLGANVVAGTSFIDGFLDDVRIYDRGITAAEVLAIANATGPTYFPYFSTDDYDFDEYMDLALWLPFDSDETPDYIDKGPIGNDGVQATASDQPTFSSDNGGVYDFDKVDDYIDVAHSASISFDNDDAFSIVTWVKQDAARIGSSSQMFAKYDGTTGYLNYLSSDKLSLFLQQTGGSRLFVQSTATFTDTNTWYNFASTYDGSSDASGVTLYAQGASTADSHTSDSLAGSIVNSVSGNIGAFGGSSHLWSGLISEVRIYDRVLTAAEVLAIYNNTKATYGL